MFFPTHTPPLPFPNLLRGFYISSPSKSLTLLPITEVLLSFLSSSTSFFSHFYAPQQSDFPPLLTFCLWNSHSFPFYIFFHSAPVICITHDPSFPLGLENVSLALPVTSRFPPSKPIKNSHLSPVISPVVFFFPPCCFFFLLLFRLSNRLSLLITFSSLASFTSFLHTSPIRI